MARYTMRLMPARWHLSARTSPTAWQAATQRVEASSRFTAHSLVEQESTGVGESQANTSAVTWCWERVNTNLRREEEKEKERKKERGIEVIYS